jgi:hypothetical protein
MLKHTHIYTYTYVNTSVHIYTHTYTCEIYIYIHTYIYIHVRIYIYKHTYMSIYIYAYVYSHMLIKYTGYTQKNGADSKLNKKFNYHLSLAQHTPSAAAIVQVSRALFTILQFVHPGSHDTHPYGNKIHPRLGVACPL